MTSDGLAPRTLDLTPRPGADTGYVFVDPAALTDRALRAWLDLGLSFVRTLPAKAAATPARRKRAGA